MCTEADAWGRSRTPAVSRRPQARMSTCHRCPLGAVGSSAWLAVLALTPKQKSCHPRLWQVVGILFLRCCRDTKEHFCRAESAYDFVDGVLKAFRDNVNQLRN